MLDFIHLSETGVAEMVESTNLKGCPHTFVYLVTERAAEALLLVAWRPSVLDRA